MRQVMRSGVYISYPFCAQKCAYCNFASGVASQQLERDYLQAIHAEIAAHPWNAPPDTVYIGGGTPSRLDAASLSALLRLLPGAPWSEATLEAAPGTLSADLCAAWRDAGIDRISFGVQSFVPAELAKTGRTHTPAVVAHEVALLRAAQILNINIDLIAGLPGQTPSSWSASLDWIERLDPPHVSVYMLEIDDESRLGREVLLNGRRYGAPDVPDDDAVAALYESAVDRLRRLGFEGYEISNFARPGFASIHNLKYWQRLPYVGFGADAHSFDGVLRSQNVDSAADYVAHWRAGQSPSLDGIPADPASEKFFVGLRLSEGVEPAPSEWHRWSAPIGRFVSAGLLQTAGNRLKLTDRGVLLSNEVFAEFLA